MTYAEFEEYFVQLFQEDEDLKSAIFVTDWSEILELQQNKKLYPCLVIEIFEISSDSEGGSPDLTIEGAYSVISGMPTGEKRERYRAILQKNLQIICRVKERIDCDGDAQGLFEPELKTQFNPITKATADNAYGWRGYFSIGGITVDYEND